MDKLRTDHRCNGRTCAARDMSSMKRKNDMCSSNVMMSRQRDFWVILVIVRRDDDQCRLNKLSQKDQQRCWPPQRLTPCSWKVATLSPIVAMSLKCASKLLFWETDYARLLSQRSGPNISRDGHFMPSDRSNSRKSEENGQFWRHTLGSAAAL